MKPCKAAALAGGSDARCKVYDRQGVRGGGEGEDF